MDTSFLNTFTETANEIGHFLFETFAGIAILVGGCLLITLIIAVLLEFKTRNKYKNHEIEDSEVEANNA